MDCVIRWQTFVNRENQMLAEARIAADIEAGRFPFEPCHVGSVLIVLSCADLFNMCGTVQCRCGAAIGSLSGACDGSGLRYSDSNCG